MMKKVIFLMFILGTIVNFTLAISFFDIIAEGFSYNLQNNYQKINIKDKISKKHKNLPIKETKKYNSVNFNFEESEKIKKTEGKNFNLIKYSYKTQDVSLINKDYKDISIRYFFNTPFLLTNQQKK